MQYVSYIGQFDVVKEKTTYVADLDFIIGV